MDKIDELIKMVDNELEYLTPGSDEWKALLNNREDLIRQKCTLMEQDRKNIEHKCAKKPSPDTVMQCVTGLVQVVGIAVVGFMTRVDREALRFIRRP